MARRQLVLSVMVECALSSIQSFDVEHHNKVSNSSPKRAFGT